MIAAFRTIGLAAGLSLCAGLAQGEMITLKEIGGDSTIKGELLSYDGNHYVLRTSLGDLTLLAAQSACEGTACPDILSRITDLAIAGSGTVTGHLIPQLANAHFGDVSTDLTRSDTVDGQTHLRIDRTNETDLQMTLVHSNSSTGLQGLVTGALHAAFTTRPASAEESLRAGQAGITDLRSAAQEQVIAHDALLVVTHPSNPIRAMSENHIAEVFAGQIRNWSELGRVAGPINVYMREANSNARDLLTQVVMSPHRKKLSGKVSVLRSDAEIAEAVRKDPNAIGLTSFVYAEGVNALEIEGVCGIRVPATEFTIKTAEYPLARPVYFYHNAERAHDSLKNFAAFMTSEAGQQIIRKAGFVDRRVQSEPLNMQGLRVSHAILGEQGSYNMQGTRNMLKLMSYSERLSTTIRFDNGSTRLDSTDLEGLDILAELIRSDDYDGAHFYFMGFSDSIGRADLNQFLALKRAEIVRAALVRKHPDLAARIKARSVGYGELSPLACNETRPGRMTNRRVEVWVHNPLTLASR